MHSYHVMTCSEEAKRLANDFQQGVAIEPFRKLFERSACRTGGIKADWMIFPWQEATVDGRRLL